MGKIPSIEKLLFNIAEYSDFLPILISLVFLLQIKKWGLDIWLLFSYIVFSIISVYLADIFPKTTVPYFVSFITLVEYTCFILFLWLNIQKSKIKNLALFVSLLFLIFITVYSIKVKIRFIDTIPIGVETIIILFFSFYFFYEQMNIPKTTFIYTDYRFWVIIGMTIYLAGSFFIYIFADQFDLKDPIEQKQYFKFYSFTYLFYALKNLFFSLGIFIYVKNPKQTTRSKSIPYLDMDLNHVTNR